MLKPGTSLESALPNRQRTPASSIEFIPGLLIPHPCASDLLPPEVGSRRGPLEQMAVVAVPEAAIHENNGIESREHQVGPPWEVRSVEPIAEAHRVKPPSYHHLRPRVLPANARHHSAAGGLVYDVRQRGATASPLRWWTALCQ